MAEAQGTMTSILFSHDALARDLSKLEFSARVVFAASCSERILLSYLRQSEHDEDGRELRGVLTRVWQHVLGTPMSIEEAESARERCLAVVEDAVSEIDDERSVHSRALAEDAAAAVTYTLRALDGPPEEAAWVASRAYEAVDYYVSNQLGVADDMILVHPAVQLELSRQRRDLDELLSNSKPSVVSFSRFRERAVLEADTFLPLQT